MDENQISYDEIDKEIEERAAAKRRRLPHDIFDFSELVLIVAAVLLLLTSFLFRQTVVSGGSMRPTLEGGERLVISNFFYTPRQGDIVVLQVEKDIADKHPTLIEHQAIIKRVIAIEGQTVSVVNGTVYVDGEPLSEDYALKDASSTEAITVSEGHIFVMGDNRIGSLDSRSFGEVDKRAVIGKVLFRFLPFSRFGGVQ